MTAQVDTTDPARELVDACIALNRSSAEQGYIFLAKEFGVQAWSTEFFQVISAVNARIDLTKEIVSGIETDSDIKDHVIEHFVEIRNAFTQSGLMNAWDNAVKNFINEANTTPIKMLSMTIRKDYGYPRLSEVDAREIVAAVDELIGWLNEMQLRESDFIRQAIIDGLIQFRFRLQRLKWLGTGYAISSLRDVISAYLILEQGVHDPNLTPDAAAVIKKTGTLISSAFQKVGVAKSVFETAGWGLKMYGATQIAIATKQGLSGFLAHMP